MSQERTVLRKMRVGTVVSDKNDKTIVVSVERAARHRIYHKVIRRTKKYHAHDEQNQATRGDVVRIEEAAPTSKTKRWKLVEILTEREVAQVAPESIDQSLVEEVQRSASHAEDEHTEGAAAPSDAPASEATAEAPAAEEASSDEEEEN